MIFMCLGIDYNNDIDDNVNMVLINNNSNSNNNSNDSYNRKVKISTNRLWSIHEWIAKKKNEYIHGTSIILAGIIYSTDEFEGSVLFARLRELSPKKITLNSFKFIIVVDIWGKLARKR